MATEIPREYTTKTKTEEKTTMAIDNDEAKATGAAKADDAE